MEIRYTLTIAEFKEAYGVMLRNASMWHRICYRAFTWLGPLIGVVLLLLALLLFSIPHPNQPFVFLLAVIALANLFAPWRYRRSVRRSYRLQNLDTEVSVSADSTGIVAKRANKDSVTRYGWTAIERYNESKTSLVLFVSRLHFIPIPKRAMTSEQQSEIQELLDCTPPEQRFALMRTVDAP